MGLSSRKMTGSAVLAGEALLCAEQFLTAASDIPAVWDAAWCSAAYRAIDEPGARLNRMLINLHLHGLMYNDNEPAMQVDDDYVACLLALGSLHASAQLSRTVLCWGSWDETSDEPWEEFAKNLEVLWHNVQFSLRALRESALQVRALIET